MVGFYEAMQIFEDEAQRLVWLPSISLGYVYTLRGEPLQFVLAVAALVRDKHINNLIDWHRTQVYTRDDSFAGRYARLIQNEFPQRKQWSTAIISVAHLFTMFYAPYLIWLHFSHSDIVLVALGILYSGLVGIVLTNI